VLGEASDHIAANRPHTTGDCADATWGVDRLCQVFAGQADEPALAILATELVEQHQRLAGPHVRDEDHLPTSFDLADAVNDRFENEPIVEIVLGLIRRFADRLGAFFAIGSVN